MVASDVGSDTNSEQEEYYTVWGNNLDRLLKFKSCSRHLGENPKTEGQRLSSMAIPKLPIIELPTFTGDDTE